RRIDADLARLRAFALGALDGERPGVFAVGIVRAADERAIAAELDVEAAGAADRAEPRILGAGHGGGEIAPEILEHLLPGDMAVGDLVELVLEIGGEIVFDIALEEARQERGHEPAAVLRDETLLVEPHIVAVLQDLNDRGVGGRPADAELFELLDEARLAVARRRLCEMLLGLDLAALERLALLQGRQAPPFLILLGIVDILAIEREITVEGDGRAIGAQHDLAVGRADIDRNLIDERGCHLARDRALPDQLVKPALLVVEIARDRGWSLEHVGRTDGLVRFLRVLRLGAVDARLVRMIVLAVVFDDQAARRGDRLA